MYYILRNIIMEISCINEVGTIYIYVLYLKGHYNGNKLY